MSVVHGALFSRSVEKVAVHPLTDLEKRLDNVEEPSMEGQRHEPEDRPPMGEVAVIALPLYDHAELVVQHLCTLGDQDHVDALLPALAHKLQEGHTCARAPGSRIEYELRFINDKENPRLGKRMVAVPGRSIAGDQSGVQLRVRDVDEVLAIDRRTVCKLEISQDELSMVEGETYIMRSMKRFAGSNRAGVDRDQANPRSSR